MTAGTNNLCLICHSEITAQQQLDNRDYFHPPNPKLLSQDLGNYFLLRHILNLTSDQIQNYLRYCPCPRDWVKVCSDCSVNYVDKCTRIFLEFLELKRSLRAARNEIIEAVRRSVENEGKFPVPPSDVLDIPRDVRRLVAQREKEADPDHSAGDSEATQRILEHCKGLTDHRSLASIDFVSELDPFDDDDIKPDIFEAPGSDHEQELTRPIEIASFPSDTEFHDESETGDWCTNFEDNVTLPQSDANSKTEASSHPKKTRKRHRPIIESDKACKYCGTVYSKQYANTHQKTCSKNPAAPNQPRPIIGANRKQKCDICGSAVKFQKMFEHMESHVGDFAIKCPNEPCPYVFSNSRRVWIHTTSHCKFVHKTAAKHRYVPAKTASFGDTYLHTCETCGFESYKRYVFKKHLELLHERASKKNYTCPVPTCEESFTVRQSVDFHLSTHTFRKTTLQRCDLCSERVEVEQMVDHLTGVHKMEETFPCPHCPFVFSPRAYLAEHLFKHSRLGFSCDICGRDVNFVLHRQLCKHYETEHHVDFTHLTCKICGKITTRQTSLRLHIAQKHAGSDAPDNVIPNAKKVARKPVTLKTVPCNLCLDPAVLYDYSSLFTHKVKEHGLDPLECKTCGKQYSSISGLDSHKRLEHLGIKDRPCPQPGCGKVFNTQEKLKTHLRICHKEKEHLCSECGKKFPTDAKLRRHYTAVHLGTRTHVCEICGKSFTTVQSLREHVTMHTGETPYRCSTCGRNFRLRTSFSRHAKVHVRMGANYKPRGPKPGERRQ